MTKMPVVGGPRHGDVIDVRTPVWRVPRLPEGRWDLNRVAHVYQARKIWAILPDSPQRQYFRVLIQDGDYDPPHMEAVHDALTKAWDSGWRPDGRPAEDKRQMWLQVRLQARIWWCGDEACDCTEPMIERIKPNLEAGYPWIHRETVWEGEFLTETWIYGPQEREQLQYAPLRAACAQFGVAVPPEIPQAEE